jgi:hypothetical protein
MVSREKRIESNLNIVDKATIITKILKYRISVSNFSTQLKNKNLPAHHSVSCGSRHRLPNCEKLSASATAFSKISVFII